jgi:hypothetical protein
MKIKDLPQEIKELALLRQKEAGNEVNEEADKSKRINPLNGVYYSYKIIIPQEEPNQEIIATEEDAKIFVDAIENPPDPNEKLKRAFGKQLNQETLEEAAERIAENFKNVDFKAGVIYGIIEGAKWQAERMYSDDEVIAFVKWMYDYKADINKVEELFEQFKK